MNASGFTNGGLTSTNTFWKISIPLVVGSIIIPIAFSGLLIRKIMQVAFVAKAFFSEYFIYRSFLIAVMKLISFSSVLNIRTRRKQTRRNEEGDGQKRHQSSPDNNEGVSDQILEMA